MSTLVTNELFAQPGRGDDVANLLLEILGESLQYEGCETIRIVRDQDDPDHVAGFTQWTERRNFDDYLAWRTERGFTGTFGHCHRGPAPRARPGPPHPCGRRAAGALMAIDLDDAVALVTGGANGMGAATARRLATRGARVVVAVIVAIATMTATLPCQ
jgi:quinol monooxygenase YgiN